ncbi:MAG TPA: D-glycerate dehydrogenase [Rhodopila sp.]|nr:D-glycerate dehydrogenase [Rhodopila sp.]
MTERPRIVLSCLTTTAVVARVRAEFDAIVAEGPDDMSVPEVLHAAAQHRAQGIVFTNTLPVSAAMLADLAGTVRVGATISVGYDHVDVAAARARGMMVTNTPGVLDECTADHAMMLMLAAARRGLEYDRIMRQGWRYRIGQGELLGVRVSGKRVGVIGMGRIGRAFAQRARGFGMQVMYHARTRLPAELEQGAEYYASLRDMLPRCDFLSIHAPGGPATDRMIDAQALALLPDNAVLVNVARGSLVDEDALHDALTSGKLFAAGLDVFRAEPDFDLRFAALNNVVLSPHVGSATTETRDAMGFRALDNVAAVLSGRPALDPLWKD